MAMTTFFALYLSDADILAEQLLESIPIRVWEVLGRADTTPNELARLLKLAKRYPNPGPPGCYLALSKDPRSTSQETGVYVGSSCRGIRKRVADHKRNIRATANGGYKEQSTFYRFAAKPGVETDFFLLARMDPAQPQVKGQSLLLEGILQAYLNVVREAK